MAVLALLLGRHLAKRLPCPGHEKNRVVAEPSLATPLRHDLPPALALEEPRPPAGRRQGDRAHETRLPRARHRLQPAQQLRRALLLRRPEARRADARESAQRLHLDPRVIAERR